MSIDQLALNIAFLAPHDQKFANSLIDQARQGRTLSSKQMFWVNKLVEKAVPPVQATPVQTQLSASGIIALIRRNNNAKRPKIRFLVGEKEITLSVAGSKTRYPGTINVVAGNRWYGRIHEDGRYEQSAASWITQEEHMAVFKAMELVAADPAKAAAEYGKKTGRCCFCSLPLTDHRSLQVGYGAICAKNYKLPWNASELEIEMLVPQLTEKQQFG